MADNFNDFLSLPCWFTIPLVAAYLFLLGYVVYLLWQLRPCHNNNEMNHHKDNETIND